MFINYSSAAYGILLPIILMFCLSGTDITFANDFNKVYLYKNNTPYVFCDGDGRTFSLKRDNCNVYIIRENSSVLLDELMNGAKQNCRWGAPDLLMGDLNYDGHVEFFIKKSDGTASVWYYLVDQNGNDIYEEIFEKETLQLIRKRLEIDADEQIWFSLPQFDKKKKTFQSSSKDGPFWTTQTYQFLEGKYVLVEESFPLYEQSPAGNADAVILEKYIAYNANNTPKTVRINEYGTTHEVYFLLREKTVIFASPNNNLAPINYFEADVLVEIIDAQVDSNDSLWLKIKKPNTNHMGWVKGTSCIKAAK